MDGKRLAPYRLEFKYSSQCDDLLRNWVIVPVKGGVGGRLFEVD